MILRSVEQLLSTYGAGLVGLVVALEAMGLPLPGESMIIAGALYCATTHKVAIGWMLGSAFCGAVMGDNAGYLIGRGLGFRLLAKYGQRVGLSADRLTLGRYVFKRYGASVVFVGRFVAILRTFAALLAGANRMIWTRFLFWNALGGACWVGGYGLGAYYLGTEVKRLQGPIGLGLGVVVIVLLITGSIYLKRNEHRLTRTALTLGSSGKPV